MWPLVFAGRSSVGQFVGVCGSLTGALVEEEVEGDGTQGEDG